MSIEKLFGDFYKEEPLASQGLTLREKRRKERGSFGRRRAAIALLLVLTLLSGILLQNLLFKKQMDQSQSQSLPLPTQEKIADGAWILKNREPIHQVLASDVGPKVETTLIENTKALEQLKSQIAKRKSTSSSFAEASEDKQNSNLDPTGLNARSYTLAANEEIYRWSVTLPSGTVFAFGQQEVDGILPVVKVTSKEGWFVRYYPSVQRLASSGQGIDDLVYVKPKVKGNVISWEISKGITARYTMLDDRVKADYIVESKEALCPSSVIASGAKQSKVDGIAASAFGETRNDDGCESPKLDFIVETNMGKLDRATTSEKEVAKQIKAGRGEAVLQDLPTGDIALYNDLQQEVFTIPAPIVEDAKKEKLPNTRYQILNTSDGVKLLSIILPKDKLENSSWPLTIDPVVIDAAAPSPTATAYGNGRKLLRDAYGNLIAFMNGGTGNDNVYYKNYNAASWTDAQIDLDGEVDSSQEISADLDSTGSAHVVFHDDFGASIEYIPLKITRDANNAISSIGTTATLLIDTTTTMNRPSLVVANKGAGGAAEKVAVVWPSNQSGGGGGKRGEMRFMQCSLTDGCSTAANWKNADASETGSGACTDGTAGFPSSVTCTGAADPVLRVSSTATINHGVLTQIPGRPKRSPTDVIKFASSTYTSLPNLRDNNTGTSSTISLDNFTNYLYIGDTNRFSKVTFDVETVNAAVTTLTVEYWNGSAWTTVSNGIDNTKNTGPFNEDGSYLFDEPSDWTTTSVNSVDGKYWVRFSVTGTVLNTLTSVAEVYITDRNARALMVVGGIDIDNDLRASYIPWDEINNDRWENNPAVVGNGWREDAGGASSALSDTGFEAAFTNYVLSATTDPINNSTYVGYMEGTAVGSSNITIKSVPNNKDVTVAASWTDAALPATTEATNSVISLAADGQDLYIFYVLNSDVASGLVWKKCSPQTAGFGTICDNASDWGAENTLINSTQTSDHPQPVVSKAFGDTVAIDVIFTNPNDTTVEYERHYVDNAYATKTVTASGQDAYHRDCDSGTDDQNINFNTVKLGREATDVACDSSAHSKNHAGFLFPGIPITQGAKVASAYLDVRVATASAGAVKFTVYGEDTDSSTPFTALTNCTDPCSDAVGARTKTTSSKAFETDGITLVTNSYRIDVTNIVQEIVCRGAANSQPCVGDFNSAGSWNSQGNVALLLIASDTGSSDNFAGITSFDNTSVPMLDPTLQINLGNSSYNFSMGAATQLASGSASFANLDHPMATTSGELGAVLTDDTRYASISATNQYASPSGVPSFMFKVNNTNNNNTYKIDAQAIVKSTATASAKPVYLQVYRAGSTNNWETVASNNSSPGDTDMTLNAITIASSVDEYYQTNSPNGTCNATGTDCWVFFRLYQDTPTTLQIETLSVDYFNVTFSEITAEGAVIEPRIEGKVRIQGGVRISN
ncbi:MAG: hypothetical protein Q8Q49_01215 [bacterium]|nr:hypothetical protein [bacterium]